MSPTRAGSSESNGDDAALVIGNFDGVHRGHQALVTYTLELAKGHGLRPMAMTFDPHPAVALGGAEPAILTTLPRKIELLQALEPELGVHVQRFDRQFARLAPSEFVEQVLVGDLKVRQLVVGANFRFGRERSGNTDVLAELGRQMGFVAHAFRLEGDADGIYSSSRIRRFIAEGELERANELLTRPHYLTGTVVTGDGRGRTIDVPTANLAGVVEARPLDGVYAAVVEMLGPPATRSLGHAVVHIGPRPTVARDSTIEVHLLDQTLDLYGKVLRVGLTKRIRGLVRFTDLEALKLQIAHDIAQARASFDPEAR